MKRDFELIRTLLLKVEDESKPGEWYEPEVIGFDDLTLQYHVKMLSDKGLLEAKDLSSKDGMSFVVTGMTMEGHDYLDAIRNNSVWEKTKKKITEKALSFTFDIIKTVAGEIAKQTLGIS